MTQVLAAVVESSAAPMKLKPLHLDDPRPDEIMVRLVATGVCHTDATMWQQGVPVPQPVVLGHEGAGIVETVGSAVSRIAVGDKVVMSFDSCGTCPSCRADAQSYCYEFFPRNFFGTRPDGSTTLRDSAGTAVHGNVFGQSSFATFALCNERNAVVVPGDFDLRIAGPLGCGIQTGAGAVMKALAVGSGQSVAVFGAGSVGLAAVMAAKAVGAGPIVAIDVKAERLKLAGELGANILVDAKAGSPVEQILEQVPGGVNYSLDCTGIARVIEQAVAVLAIRGVCGIVGASAPGINFAAEISHVMSGGRTIRGIVEGDANPKTFIPELIALHAEGRFPFDRLISFYPLERINEAFQDADSGVAIKPVILFE